MTLLFIFLPLLEIAGFVVIGGEIGLGWSLLWVITATIAGFYSLFAMGLTTLHRAQMEVAADRYPLQAMFDGLCILIGAMLLIFPGFISDALALLFLLPWVRNGVFWLLKAQHESVLEEFTSHASVVSEWYSEKNSRPVIEGDYTVVENPKEKDQ